VFRLLSTKLQQTGGTIVKCVMGRLVHTGLGSSSLVANVLPYPPPPHVNIFVLGPAVINTHTHCHGPQRTRSCSNKHTHGCALGSVGNPFDRVWPPTTSGDLQPIFSCVDSRGTHPLCVYVREYSIWCVRGYVLGEEGVNASTSRGRNSKLEG
jgi:hypothetical protein